MCGLLSGQMSNGCSLHLSNDDLINDLQLVIRHFVYKKNMTKTSRDPSREIPKAEEAVIMKFAANFLQVIATIIHGRILKQ